MAHFDKRIYKRCIFCSREFSKKQTGLRQSKEHIFGKRLAKEILPENIYWEVVRKAGIPFFGPSPILSKTSQCVCESCNNGWMRNEINNAYPTLIKIVKGERVALDTMSVVYLIRYFQRMSFILDLETSKVGIPEKYKTDEFYEEYGESNKYSPLLTKIEREIFFNSRNELGKSTSLLDIRIYLSHHKGVLGLNPHFNFAKLTLEGSPLFGKFMFKKVFTIIIGELGILISIPGEVNKLIEPYSRLDSSLMTWPKHPKLSYMDSLEYSANDKDTIQSKYIYTNIRKGKFKKIEKKYRRIFRIAKIKRNSRVQQ